jgi:hypothetical protein
MLRHWWVSKEKTEIEASSLLLNKLYVLFGHPESILQFLQGSLKLNFTLGVDMEGVVSAEVLIVGVSKVFPDVGTIGVVARASIGQRSCTSVWMEKSF